MAVELTDVNFKEEVLNSNVPVLVDFWAGWCQPCLILAPVLEEIAKEYEGRLKVGKASIDDTRETAVTYEVMNIPTMVIFKNGQVIDKIVGVVPKEVIQSKINSHLL